MADANINDTVADDNTNDIDIQEEKRDKRKIEFMRNAYQKLDNLPLTFGLPAYSENIPDENIKNRFGIDLKDSMREMGISDILSVQEDSYVELILENRIVYHAIKRFRNSAAVFFKFSTAIDGKTVDKTKVPEMLGKILKDYEDEYKEYNRVPCGSIWQMEVDSNNG